MLPEEVLVVETSVNHEAQQILGIGLTKSGRRCLVKNVLTAAENRAQKTTTITTNTHRK